MQKGKISNKEGALICALAGLTNAFSVLPGAEAGRMVWVADIIATALAILCVFLLTGACDKYPEKTFFEVLTKVFGKVFGRVVGIILALFSLMTFVVSLTVFSRFVQITALPQTAQIVIPLLISVTSALSLSRGLYAPSGAAWLLFWFVAFVVVVSAAFGFSESSLRLMTFKMPQPLKIISGAGEVFLNRFGEIFALMSVYTRMQGKNSRRKHILTALFGVGLALSLISATTVFMLGENLSRADFYPVYTAVSLHSAGGFIQHIEIFACIAMTICIFFKGVLCILFSEDIIMESFSAKRVHGIAVPISLSAAAFTQIIYGSVSTLRGMLEWKPGAGYVVLAIVIVSASVAVLSGKGVKTN